MTVNHNPALMLDLAGEIRHNGYSTTDVVLAGDTIRVRDSHSEDKFEAVINLQDPESWSLKVTIQTYNGVVQGEMTFFHISTTTIARAVLAAIDNN